MAKAISTVSSLSINSIEDIISNLGGFGRFQVYILVLVMVLEIPAALVFFSPVFTGVKPKNWTCDNETIPLEEICLCNGTLESESSSIVSEWTLVCDLSPVSDLITSIQMIGTVLGSPVFGPLADWFGRKYTYAISAISMAIGAIISAVAPDMYTFAFSRLIVGIGFAGFANICGAYTMEFMAPNMRAICTAVGPMGEGIMLLGLLGYCFPDSWRSLQWACAAPYILIFVIVPILPESPRWLIRNDRTEDAIKIFNQMAKMNRKMPVSSDVIRSVAKLERSNCTTSSQIGYVEFFKDKTLRNTTFFLQIITSILILAYYGISFNLKNLKGDPYVNVVLLGLCDAIGYPLSFIINIFLTRRRTLAVFMTASSIFLVALAIIQLSVDVSDKPAIVLTLCMLGKFAAAGARACSRTVTAESYPTSVRNMGMGIVWMAPAAIAVLAPFLALLGSSWPSAPQFILAAVSIIGAAVSFLLTETKGKPLQE